MYIRLKKPTLSYQLEPLTYFAQQIYVNILYIYKFNFLPHLISHSLTSIETTSIFSVPAHSDVASNKHLVWRVGCTLLSSVLSDVGFLSLLSLLYPQKLYNTQHATVVIHLSLTLEFNALSTLHRFSKIPNAFSILTLPRCKH